MARRNISAEERERLKRIWDYTDEQIEKLTPKQWVLMERGAKFAEWRLVAEIVEARNCLGQHKVGQRYVFNASGFLLPHESTVPRLCSWAIAPMIPFTHMLYDRIIMDADPSSFCIDCVECLDVGVEQGGYGKVRFRMYCEKAPKKG